MENDSNGVFRWEDPPAPRYYKGAWRDRLLPLSERPAVWARVYIGPNSNASKQAMSRLRHGLVAYVDPKEFEFRCHEATIYARRIA